MVARKVAVFFVVGMLMVLAVGCGGQGDVIKIGITQIEEHPALDAARQGFIDGLAQAGFDKENIRVEYQSAQGDVANAQLIAENFVATGSELILAISTPSAQMAFQATREIPILITAVTDPVSEGLAQSWEKSGTNVTGTSDSAPIDKHLDIIRVLIPDAAKIGIIYNTSEANSQVQVDKVKDLAAAQGLEVVTAGITDISDIQVTLEALLPKVDVLYTPTDNLVVSAMGLVVDVAKAHATPVIGSEESQVVAGALATQGIDYYQLGIETAQMAVQVLEGGKPSDMGIKTLQETRLLINRSTAESLGIIIPQELADQADFVGDER